MKIIGGSFGLKGSAYFSGKVLVIDSAQKAQYSGESVVSVSARTDSERKFGVIGAAVGVLLFGAIGLVFFGILGATAGVVLAVAGSFYSTKTNIAELKFDDGKTLSVECTQRAVNKLVAFGH
jgi:hypothetical protein